MKKYISIIIISCFTLITSMQAQSNNSTPCSAKEYAQFDFWVGSWEVTNPNGSMAGSNKIEKIQGGCVLKENWTSATPGYTGTSYNFYNAAKKQWEQMWVDNQGGSLHLKGHKTGNQMILRTDDLVNADGKSFYHQITWTANNDGSVRQYWETFVKGADVAVAFDGLYKKKN